MALHRYLRTKSQTMLKVYHLIQRRGKALAAIIVLLIIEKTLITFHLGL